VTAGEARAYAGRLTDALAQAAGGALRCAYLHGSAALGGWVAERSDVDLLIVVSDDIGGPALSAVGDALLAWHDRSPGTGLECSVVSASQAGRPGPPWPFLLHLGGERRLISGDEAGGDRDLLLHYAVCLAAGVAVLGPPPAECIGPLDRAAILTYLADEMDWGLAHAPEPYGVLNACRALVFLADGRIVSKVEGGKIAIDNGTAPADLVARALDQQLGRSPERRPDSDAATFVRTVAGSLRSAAEGRRYGNAVSYRNAD
jgi:streptomycin 3"-adenylyltransferase